MLLALCGQEGGVGGLKMTRLKKMDKKAWLNILLLPMFSSDRNGRIFFFIIVIRSLCV